MGPTLQHRLTPFTWHSEPSWMRRIRGECWSCLRRISSTQDPVRADVLGPDRPAQRLEDRCPPPFRSVARHHPATLRNGIEAATDQVIDVIKGEPVTGLSASTFPCTSSVGPVERIDRAPLWKRSEIVAWANSTPGQGAYRHPQVTPAPAASDYLSSLRHRRLGLRSAEVRPPAPGWG